MTTTLTVCGMQVSVFREDFSGLLTVAIDTESVSLHDEFTGTGVPRLCVSINGDDNYLNEFGKWVKFAE